MSYNDPKVVRQWAEMIDGTYRLVPIACFQSHRAASMEPVNLETLANRMNTRWLAIPEDSDWTELARFTVNELCPGRRVIEPGAKSEDADDVAAIKDARRSGPATPYEEFEKELELELELEAEAAAAPVRYWRSEVGERWRQVPGEEFECAGSTGPWDRSSFKSSEELCLRYRSVFETDADGNPLPTPAAEPATPAADPRKVAPWGDVAKVIERELQSQPTDDPHKVPTGQQDSTGREVLVGDIYSLPNKREWIAKPEGFVSAGWLCEWDSVGWGDPNFSYRRNIYDESPAELPSIEARLKRLELAVIALGFRPAEQLEIGGDLS